MEDSIDVLDHSKGDNPVRPVIQHAAVYGGDHSPWVQAVLLGLAEQGIHWTLQSIPSPATFLKWGVLMPTVSFDGGQWRKESAEILVEMGYERLTDKDALAIQTAWTGVTYRPQQPLRFLASFSEAGDASQSFMTRTVSNFFRGFIALYMMTLMSIVRLSGRVRDPINWGDQFLHWENLLASSSHEFMDGKRPGARDLLLFGMVQCHSSITVPPLAALQKDERLARLRAWIGIMQSRFAACGHLYSGQFFEPKLPPPPPASPFQRVIFFAGLFSMVALLPITLPLIIFLIVRVPR